MPICMQSISIPARNLEQTYIGVDNEYVSINDVQEYVFFRKMFNALNAAFSFQKMSNQNSTRLYTSFTVDEKI